MNEVIVAIKAAKTKAELREIQNGHKKRLATSYYLMSSQRKCHGGNGNGDGRNGSESQANTGRGNNGAVGSEID